MFKLKYLIIISILSAIGCTPNIVDRDFEQEEYDYIEKYGKLAAEDPLWQNPTESSLFLTKEDDVTVTVHKTEPDDDEGIMLQNWTVVVVNHNNTPVCVNIAWKLMGFKMISDYPGYRYMKRNMSIVDYVTLKQTIWNLDGTRFALPPSGYIAYMDVREPKVRKSRFESAELCEFYEDEESIVER